MVSTPIGNLRDITLRAIDTLREVALIAAEDTRETRKLLQHHQIETPLISYHDHNKEYRTDELLTKLKDGMSIALVTDAGTPSISDPGHNLVCEAIAAGVELVPIPGASAVTAALSVSGLPTDTFVFVGFLPRKTEKRRQMLFELSEQHRTLVFYESPKRLARLVQELLNVLGDRPAVMARELTKIHEEIVNSPLSALAQTLSSRSNLKGECTLLVGGKEKKQDISIEDVEEYLRRLMDSSEGTLPEQAKLVAQMFQIPKSVVYEAALKIRQEKTSGTGGKNANI